MESLLTQQFISSVGVPGFICIIVIFCVGKTNKELKDAIDALTNEIKTSNIEQKNKIDNIESDIRELKNNVNYLQIRLGVNNSERH
jgi:SMC interacting uncharacterized protein involved in chromosome segregation